MMNKKLVIALVPVLVLLIALIGVLGFMLVEEKDDVYLQRVQSAEKFLSSGDIENAILYYREAIYSDNTMEEPYIKLAEIYYIYLGDLNSAIEVLQEGYNNTLSGRIQTMLTEYQSSLIKQPVEETKADSGSSDKGMVNTTLMNIFASYTYETYTSKLTTVTETKENGTYTVTYAQYDAVFEYSNSPYNTSVVDIDSGIPYSYARPTSIKFNNLSDLISGVDQGVSVDDLKSRGISTAKLNPNDVNIGSEYISFSCEGCEVMVACDSNGIIIGTDCYNSIVPPVGNPEINKVAVSGRIIDVTTAQLVSNVAYEFVSTSEGVVAEGVSITGEYQVEIAPGNYTVKLSADGYNTESFSITVPQTDSLTQDFSISPELSESQIRIVLEWGSAPADLDSHLEGRSSDGTAVDVYFMNQIARSGNKEIANLDVDDISGYGPETITINDIGGSYEYKVHHFFGSGTLASSGAVVKVYTGDSSQPVVISIPTDITGEWWSVFRIENGNIVDINGDVL